MRKQVKTVLIILVLLTAIFGASTQAMADEITTGPLSNMFEVLRPTAIVYQQENIQQDDVQAVLIGRITLVVRYALSLLGIIFTVLILYGGYLWMTGRGNDERVQQAQSVIRNSVIGVIVIIISYAITSFILLRLFSAAID